MMVSRHTAILRTIPFLIGVCLLAFPAHAQYSGVPAGDGETRAGDKRFLVEAHRRTAKRLESSSLFRYVPGLNRRGYGIEQIMWTTCALQRAGRRV
jgi:hypothetical protein